MLFFSPVLRHHMPLTSLLSTTFNYNCTIFLTLVFVFLGYYSKVRKLLLAAKLNGMFDGTFAFITVDFVVDDKWKNEKWFKDNNGNAMNIGDVYDSFLDLSAEKPDLDNKHKNFSLEVRRRMADPPFNRAMDPSEKVLLLF